MVRFPLDGAPGRQRAHAKDETISNSSGRFEKIIYSSKRVLTRHQDRLTNVCVLHEQGQFPRDVKELEQTDSTINKMTPANSAKEGRQNDTPK